MASKLTRSTEYNVITQLSKFIKNSLQIIILILNIIYFNYSINFVSQIIRKRCTQMAVALFSLYPEPKSEYCIGIIGHESIILAS